MECKVAGGGVNVPTSGVSGGGAGKAGTGGHSTAPSTACSRWLAECRVLAPLSPKQENYVSLRQEILPKTLLKTNIDYCVKNSQYRQKEMDERNC